MDDMLECIKELEYRCGVCKKTFNKVYKKRNGEYYKQCEKCRYTGNSKGREIISINYIYKLRSISKKIQKENNIVNYIISQLHLLFYTNGISGDYITSIGCDIEVLQYYTEKKFTPDMNWRNVKLVFDKPIDEFDDIEEFTLYDNIVPKMI
jgi:hypothetical protein